VEDLALLQQDTASAAVNIQGQAIAPLQDLTSSAASAVLDNSAGAIFESLTVQTQYLVRDVMDVLSPVSTSTSWGWSLQCAPYATIMTEIVTVSMFFNAIVH